MAKTHGDFYGGRRPGFTGRLIFDTYRGVRRVRSWPKKTLHPRSAAQQKWVDWFKGANLLAKYASAQDIKRAKELSEGTYYYPRDILIKAMRGRLFWWQDVDGWKWFPTAALSDISDTLDVLAQTVGNILVRAGDRWRAPADGDEGDVLTFHPSAPPDWQPAAGGGGGAFAGALATKTSGQSVARLTNVVMVWHTEEYDTDGLLDLGASATRFTIPAGFSYCRLTAAFRWTAGNAGFRKQTFWKNGAVSVGLGALTIMNVGFGEMQAITSAVVPCAEGDYFEVVARHNHSTTLSIYANTETTYFGIQAFP